MTYVEIQNAVLADAFAEAKRASAKTWIAGRLAWLWGAEEWTFRQGGPTSVTFTANSQTVAGLPSDFRIALHVLDAYGSPLRPISDPREFFDLYNGNLSLGSGTPEAYTVWGGSILVGPKGDGSTGLLVYEKSKPTLTADGDTTGLPDGFDLALVHGAKAEGFKLSNVPMAAAFDEDFTAYYNALKRDYLVGVRVAGEQFGAYRPGGGY